MGRVEKRMADNSDDLPWIRIGGVLFRIGLWIRSSYDAGRMVVLLLGRMRVSHRDVRRG